MKFVIAGLGSIGRRHLRNLVALGEKEITLYRTHHSTLPEEDLAGYPVTSDLESALETNPDGVIVSNPTALHLDMAIPAAKRGLHILLEKPISHSMERVEELRRLADTNGSQVLMGFQFRYHPTLQKARGLNPGSGDWTTGFCPRALGRISARLASLGGSSDRVCRPQGTGRRCRPDLVPSARLPGLDVR